MARMDPTDRERRSVMRAQLQARLDELRTKVSAEIVPEPEETFNGIAGEVQDVGDASVAIAQTDLRGALLERDVTQLTAVGRALERLEDGSYGRCVDCDLEIDPARLEVLPAAERCSFCQELFERRTADYRLAVTPRDGVGNSYHQILWACTNDPRFGTSL